MKTFQKSTWIPLIIALIITLPIIGFYVIQNFTPQENPDYGISESETVPDYTNDLNEIDPTDIVKVDPNTTISGELSEKEIEDLRFMREEEKLAKDIYLSLYETTNIQAFANIAKSEQSHTNAIKQLLTQYGISDPVSTEEIGVFENTDLQKLYNDLLAQGKKSDMDALKVGALIEDLDITDLEKAKSQTTNENILLVYNNLQRGSRNHLRSFYSLIQRRGGTYTPTYMSIDDFEATIKGAHESGKS
jgi:hypothetical protein